MYERFVIFKKFIVLDNGKVEIIVLVVCVLYIFLMNEVLWYVYVDR